MNTLLSHPNKIAESKYISLSTILRLGIVLGIMSTGILFILQYLFNFPFYANAETYTLILFLCFFLYYFAKPVKDSAQNSMRLGLCSFILIMFLQRILSLIVLPFTFSGFPRFHLYSLEDLNKAIFVFLFLLVIFFCGIKTASFVPLKIKPVKSMLPDLARIRTTLYIVAIFSLLTTLVLGAIMGWRMASNWESGWIVRLFPNPMYSVMLILLWMWYGNKLPKRDKKIIAVYFAISVLWSLAQGSRSGFYSIAVILFISGVVLRGDISIPKRPLLVFLIIAVITGPLIWLLGTSIRSTGQWKLVPDSSHILMALPQISARLAGPTDNYIKIISDWGDQDVINSMMSFSTLIKVGINGFVPGELFEVPFNSSGNLWVRFMYGEILGLRVHGETWSGFGFYYLLAGYWTIMIVFLWSFFSTLIMRTLVGKKNLFSAFLALEFYLIFVHGFFDKGMLDSMIIETLYTITYVLIFYFVLIIVIGATQENPITQCHSATETP